MLFAVQGAIPAEAPDANAAGGCQRRPGTKGEPKPCRVPCHTTSQGGPQGAVIVEDWSRERNSASDEEPVCSGLYAREDQESHTSPPSAVGAVGWDCCHTGHRVLLSCHKGCPRAKRLLPNGPKPPPSKGVDKAIRPHCPRGLKPGPG